MALEREDRETVHRALRSAVEQLDTLEVFVSLKLGPNLADVTQPGNLDIMVLRVIQWADANGQIEDLLRGALDMFGGNPEVKRRLPPLLDRIQKQHQQDVNRASLQQLQSIPDLSALIANVGDLVRTLQQIAPALDTDRGRGAVEAGKRAIEKLESHGEKARLTADEQGGLEAIVMATGRPALLIEKGQVSMTPGPWQTKLAPRLASIAPTIAATGRIDVDGHAYPWLGTGFLVAPHAAAIAHYMLTTIATPSGSRWSLRQGIQVRIDLRHEYGSTATAAYPVTGVIGTSEGDSIAVLEIGDTSADGDPLPPPLRLAANPCKADQDVYLVGYAGMDKRRPEDFVRTVFHNIFDVKRLCPGQVLRVGHPPGSARSGAIEHDCSSAGGMGGAPLIDLGTGLAIGVHYGATHLVAGYATQVHQLQDTRLAKDAGLTFE